MGNRPNLLLITSDQQHWNTIGAFNPEISTPNLDRLVREGTAFTRAYCPNPTCTPTRSSLITGLYPSQHGAWTLGTKLSEKVRTVGEDFLEAGYETALVGKAHFQPLASTPEYSSLESYPVLQDLDFWRGFDETYYGFRHAELARNHANEAHVGQHYALWLEEKGCSNWRDYFVGPTGTMDKSAAHKWDIPEEYHYDAWIAERTNALLEQYKREDTPFFLWSSFFDPHPPYLVPEPWHAMYDPDKLTVPRAAAREHDANPPHFRLTQEENPDFSGYKETGFGIHGMHSHRHEEAELRRNIATYYGMTSLMDKYIGRILDKLDELGLTENTLVVFTSDHGHFYGHHGLTAKGPFHYEDLIRLPMLVRYPGHVPAGKVNASLQSLVDFAPTFLRFAGLRVPYTMSGKDQYEVWNGRQTAVRDHILCENHHEPTTIHLKTYVDERYKLTVYYKQEYGELFDLEADKEERHNRWNDPDYADIKSKLLLKYAWAGLEQEPLFMPRIAHA
ncbi:sulfatase [Paenibacillus montanisoli]|uniref:Sulfatase n=1 Tax=Paenibacillus montanisoli TaxID=2081970 RepID=A0A328UAX7_9BACL|nr:sulfatase-like hydrolase/transferase [Paenibacillus montanisoli]RAP77206.1 sulfatase [Paenibacillus montanisoli]